VKNFIISSLRYVPRLKVKNNQFEQETTEGTEIHFSVSSVAFCSIRQPASLTRSIASGTHQFHFFALNP
jgi:hypothetical protein